MNFLMYWHLEDHPVLEQAQPHHDADYRITACSKLCCVQAQVEKAKMQMESCESRKAEKQQYLASILDSISSSRVQIEKDRTHAKLLEAQASSSSNNRQSMIATLTLMYRYECLSYFLSVQILLPTVMCGRIA